MKKYIALLLVSLLPISIHAVYNQGPDPLVAIRSRQARRGHALKARRCLGRSFKLAKVQIKEQAKKQTLAERLKKLSLNNPQ